MAGVGLRLTFSAPTSAARPRAAELGLLQRVDGRRIAPLVAPLGDLGAEARGDVARDLLDLASIMSCTGFLKVRTVPRSTHSCGMTFQVSPAWIWVVDTTAVSIGSRLRGHDRLQRGDDVRADHHRVDAVMRHRAVGADALDDDLEDVVGGHHRARGGRRSGRPGCPGCCACRRRPRSGNLSNSPSSTITRPPPSFSSAGWKMK